MTANTDLNAETSFAGMLPADGRNARHVTEFDSSIPSNSLPNIVQRGRIGALGPAKGFEAFVASKGDRSFHSPLRYFETVMSYGRNDDPRAIMLMLNAYLNANQQAEGIAFFEKLLGVYGSTMSDEIRAVHLAAYAILRGTYADRVSLLKRVPWVLTTFKQLEEARRLTGGEHPIVRWAAGQIYAQVPAFFGKKQQAYEDLNWLAERPETEPVFGFYREVYRRLAMLHESDGRKEIADKFWHRSGFSEYAPSAMLMGWFTSTTDNGASMAPEPVLNEVVPGRIFALYGFGFSDIYFVLSDDNRELIAVDAGTQPHSIKAAHEFLLTHFPELPKITTALITHAHWDHVGGHGYLREHNPDVKFYGRDNYQAVVERVARHHTYEQFRGSGFDHAWVTSYSPDVPISETTELTIGGTAIELIPVTGGETEDAMLIHFPGLSATFVGDIVMPWYGEPWVNEGFIDDAVDSIDAVLARQATHILHGHHPLTALYGYDQLQAFRSNYVWLVETVREHVRHGYSAKDIVRLNLIPPGLQEHPDVYLSYLAARDNVIARTADHMVGIWREDRTGEEPGGLDSLTSVEYGRLLERYLGVTAKQAAKAIHRMISNGDNELALKFAVAAERRYGGNKMIVGIKQEAADRLRSTAQFLDPFRFVTYTEMIGQQHPPMPSSTSS
ncbi:MAG: MBL fold metallo-hydrolase [Hyphomicrobiaceae bacterium]